jgi:hypothetical protein
LPERPETITTEQSQSTSSNRGRRPGGPVAVGDDSLDGRERFAVNFGVRVDEVVERVALLPMPVFYHDLTLNREPPIVE